MAGRGLSSRRGQSAVELALVLPLLMVVIFGAVEFGTAMYDKQVVTNASREAARAAIVGTTPRLSDTLVKAVAGNYSNSRLINFKTGATTNAVTTIDPSGCTTANPCPSPNTARKSGDVITVTTTYTYSLFLVPKWLPGFGTFSLTGMTRMRME